MKRTKEKIGTKLELVADWDDLPRAAQTGWYKCDQCNSLHVMLKTKSGESFATATMDEDMLVDMLATVRGQAIS
jgi:membrane-bound inhibitor of C-type lysozyme